MKEIVFYSNYSETRNLIQVNICTGSDNPARKILIHCCYYIKQLPNGFPGAR